MQSEPNAADDLAPGRRIARYTIVRRLGAGGMGVVYEARHDGLGKLVAIKVLRRDSRGHPTVVERFVREGTAAARIRHPNVVDVTDVGVDAGVPYLVMELLDGENLGRRLARERALSVTAAADLLVPVSAAVDAAHAVGIVHRDLKPENIVLARGHGGGVVPKVVDFGIAKVLDEVRPPTITNADHIVGTPGYMAPEQLRDSRLVDARTDQYAFGAILYECVVGEPAFGVGSIYQVLTAITDGVFVPPRSARPELPAELERVILRALAHDPEARYPSMLALGRALLPFASEATRVTWRDAFARASDTAGSSAAATRRRAAPSPADARAVESMPLSQMTESRDGATLDSTPRETARTPGGDTTRVRWIGGASAVVGAAVVSLLLVRAGRPMAGSPPVRARTAAPAAVPLPAPLPASAPVPAFAPAPAPASPESAPAGTTAPSAATSGDGTTERSATARRPAGRAARHTAASSSATPSTPVAPTPPARAVHPNGALNLR